MDRPRIICHILQSVDGNIDGDFFTLPELGPAYRAFSRIREDYACDAVISGATTAAEIYRGGFIGILPKASERWPRTDRKAASAEKYAVVIDGTGSVRWESGSVERKGCFAFGKASRFATGDGSILRIEARHRWWRFPSGMGRWLVVLQVKVIYQTPGSVQLADAVKLRHEVDHIAGDMAAEAVISLVQLHAGMLVGMERAAGHAVRLDL